MKINDEVRNTYLKRSEGAFQGVSRDKTKTLATQIMSEAVSLVSQSTQENIRGKHIWDKFVTWITGLDGIEGPYRKWLVGC